MTMTKTKTIKNRYQVLEYRSPAEANKLLDLIASVSTKTVTGFATAEQQLEVSPTHTRQGKGQRRKGEKRGDPARESVV
jgi:hypothetical protein